MNQDQEVGFVTTVRNFLIHLDGLPSAKINDLVVNESGIRGWVNSLFPNSIEVLLLDEGSVIPGTIFKKLDIKLAIDSGEFLLGRTVNPLGVPLDGKGPLKKNTKHQLLELDVKAPTIQHRKFIKEQFDTYITSIDTLVPIGKGQRQLIIGDARSGKTSFLIDVIINQKQGGIICVYGSIGKPITELRSLIDVLQSNDAINHTVIIATSATDISPLIYQTPYAALTIAEYFQHQGKDVLVILDDMGNHAKIYREISLLSEKSPGKESYPGDIFYQHAHLLERAGNFNPSVGSGSITALPVMELNLSDFTGLIPTNLMGMTDGHLLFKSSLFLQGQRPPIDLNLSVSRVGKQTQQRVQNNLGFKVKQLLNQASQLETVSRFSSELSEDTQIILRQKDMIMELIKQEPLTAIPKSIQTILLALVFTPFLKVKSVDFLRTNKSKLIKLFQEDKNLKTITGTVFNLATPEELITQLEPYLAYLDKICQA